MDADKPYDISNHPRVRRVSFEDIATPLTKEEAASFGAPLKTPTVSTRQVEPDDGEVDDTLPWSDRTWDVYASTLSQLESSGRYDIAHGYNQAYDGAYGMGKAAKIDAGRILGVDLKHDPESRAAFRADPELQDAAVHAFTQSNHNVLMRISSVYRALPPARKLEVLAVSHLLGAGGGKAWLNGQEGADAFGTKGTKYAEAVRTALRG